MINLIQKIDLEIVHRADTKHKNVNFFQKEVDVVYEDDNFFDAMLISINIENQLEEFNDII